MSGSWRSGRFLCWRRRRGAAALACVERMSVVRVVRWCGACFVRACAALAVLKWCAHLRGRVACLGGDVQLAGGRVQAGPPERAGADHRRWRRVRSCREYRPSTGLQAWLDPKASLEQEDGCGPVEISGLLFS